MAKKLILIDDFPPEGTNASPVAAALQRSLCGQEVSLPDGTTWTLESIECWPNTAGQAPEQLAEQIKDQATDIGAIIVNLHLRLNPTDRRSAFRGLEVVEWLRTYPECAFPVLMHGWLERERLFKDPVDGDRFNRLLHGSGIALLQHYVWLPVAATTADRKSKGRGKAPRTFIEALAQATDRYGKIKEPDRKRWELAGELLEDLVERENHGFRHRFNGTLRLPAVRLVLGALQCGAMDEQSGRSVLGQLCKLQAEAGGVGGATLASKDYNWDLLGRYRQFVGQPFKLSKSNRRKCLLIDDEANDGWADALRGMLKPLGLDKLNVATNVQEARTKLRLNNPDSDPEYALVLLDLQLGEETTGLDLLAEIRRVHFFLPVIVFSGFDDARVAKACWQAGASYFAKQLRDPGDRRSADYFEAFAETVQAALDEVPSWLPVLWRKFVRLEDDLTRLDVAAGRGVNCSFRNGEGIADALRKVFYCLSARGRHLRYEILLGAGSRPGTTSDRSDRMTREALRQEASIYIELALETLLQTLGADTAGKALYEAWNGLSNCIRRQISVPGFKVKSFLGDIPGRIRHWQPTSPPTLYKCQQWLERTIALANACLEVKEVQSIVTTQAYATVNQPRLTLPEETHEIVCQSAILASGSHHGNTVVGKMAAKQLLHGLLLQQGSAPPKEALEEAKGGNFEPLLGAVDRCLKPCDACDGKVLLVENDPLWIEVAKQVLRTVGYEQDRVSVCESEEEVWELATPARTGVALYDHDFVVLDLWLPERTGSPSRAEVGLRLLERIKREHFALPVVMLTAANEVLPARRCLRRGAFDYLPKQCPIHEDEKQNRTAAIAYANTFIHVLQASRAKGRMPAQGREGCTRAAWYSFHKLLPRSPGLTLDDQTYQTLKGWGYVPLDDHGQPMADAQLAASAFAIEARAILRRAYFYLTLDESWFEQWRIERLLSPGMDSTEAGVLMCFWQCGMMVEMYLHIAAARLGLSGVSATTTGGQILYALHSYALPWSLAKEVWNARNDAIDAGRTGAGKSVEDCANIFRKAVRFAQQFEQWSGTP